MALCHCLLGTNLPMFRALIFLGFPILVSIFLDGSAIFAMTVTIMGRRKLDTIAARAKMALDFLFNNRFVRLAKPLTFTFITERSSHNFFAASKTQPVKFAAKLLHSRLSFFLSEHTSVITMGLNSMFSMKPLSKSKQRHVSASSDAGTTVSSTTERTMAALEEQVAQLQLENRRLKSATARIATKIGVQYSRPSASSSSDEHNRRLSNGSNDSLSSTGGSTLRSHDDDYCPPPHTILAQAHRLQKLNEMVVALTLAPRAEDAYKIVAIFTREIVGAVRVSISILGSHMHDVVPKPEYREDGTVHYHEDDYLEIFGLDGNEGAMPMGIHLPIQNTQIGHVAQTRSPVRVMDCGDCEYDWVDIQNLHEMGVAACVDVPLISSGRVMGTLNTGVTDADVYYPEVEQMLVQIAAVLASAMEKERLREIAEAASQANCSRCSN